MTRWGWRTRENGMIVVWDLPTGPERTLEATPAIAAVVDRVERDWGSLCDRHERANGLPRGVLRAHIARESGGNPKAWSEDGGWGLMQITSPDLKRGLTAAQILDPETNVGIGARFLASKFRAYGGDFVRASAAYNAGSVRPSDKNPFGMVMTTDHVEWEVRAYTYWLTKYAGLELPSQEEIDAAAQRAFALVFTTDGDPERNDDGSHKMTSPQDRDTEPEL